MDTREAARRWAEVWERGWREHDPVAIKALYADGADWSQHPFRPPDPDYVDRVFAEEESAEATTEADSTESAAEESDDAETESVDETSAEAPEPAAETEEENA